MTLQLFPPLYFISSFFKAFDYKPTLNNPKFEKGLMNYFIRPELANKLFKSAYNKLGIHIKISKDEYKELFEIEGSKLNPDFSKDSDLLIKLKQILKNKFIKD